MLCKLRPTTFTNSTTILDINEISEVLNVPKSTIYSWTSQNRIPHYKIGNHLRFNLVEVLDHFRKTSHLPLKVAPQRLNQGSLKFEEDFLGNHQRTADLSDPFTEEDSYD